jgi:SAM-dependent methyltransferase
MDDYAQYYEYLKRRSTLGLLYRRWWLYPQLCRHLYGKVLDIGCGVGDMLAYRDNTVGVDINPHTVKWCKSQGYEAELMEQNKLPFPDASFDSILLDNVLEHILSPEHLLSEIKRVLRKNGTLLIGVPGKKGFESDPDHKIFYDVDSLNQLLASVIGFVPRTSFYMPLPVKVLDARLSQFCLYSVFERDK